MRITVNSATAEISTKRKCDSSRWNVTAGRADGKTEFAKSVNDYLDLLQRKVYEARLKLLEKSLPLTAENMKPLLLGNEIYQEKRLLVEVFKRHNDQMSALVGKEYSAGTLDRYNTSFRHTQAFLLWKFNVSDIDISFMMSENAGWKRSMDKPPNWMTNSYFGQATRIFPETR